MKDNEIWNDVRMIPGGSKAARVFVYENTVQVLQHYQFEDESVR